MALPGRSAFYDLMAGSALHKGGLELLTRSFGTRERDLARRASDRIQYTAGSGPPEPLALLLRIT
jgi:hypothetical protein